jgi:TPP-dependent pyruvate/acetoin dehydrogenase alpha subunit
MGTLWRAGPGGFGWLQLVHANDVEIIAAICHPDYPLNLSAADIRDLYRDLVLVRRIDTEAIALQWQGELGIGASLLGQEAAQIGSGRALAPRRTCCSHLPR